MSRTGRADKHTDRRNPNEKDIKIVIEYTISKFLAAFSFNRRSISIGIGIGVSMHVPDSVRKNPFRVTYTRALQLYVISVTSRKTAIRSAKIARARCVLRESNNNPIARSAFVRACISYACRIHAYTFTYSLPVVTRSAWQR